MEEEKVTPIDRAKFYSWIREAYSNKVEMTARECSQYLYKKGYIPLPIRQATAPRITELTNKQVLEVVGTKYDADSKKMVSVYSLAKGE